MKKTLLIISLSLLILIAPGLPGSSEGGISPFEADNIVNAKGPDFTLKDMTGRSVSLSGFKGKVVLLNFWAKWCPP